MVVSALLLDKNGEKMRRGVRLERNKQRKMTGKSDDTESKEVEEENWVKFRTEILISCKRTENIEKYAHNLHLTDTAAAQRC